MNRHLLRSGLLLVAGAIVNVAVAWGATLSSEIKPINWRMKSGGRVALNDPVWWTFVQSDNGVVCVESLACGRAMTTSWSPGDKPPTWSMTSETVPSEREVYGLHRKVREVAAGWPQLSCYSQSILDDPSKLWEHRFGLCFANERQYHVVPFGPSWPGFAINTIFYAAMLWVAFVVPGMVRRRIRRRRGRCPACAYPVGTSEVCTECGAAVVS